MNDQNNPSNIVLSHRAVFHTIVAFWFMGWYLKAYFFMPYIYGELKHFPVLNNFFPFFFRDQTPLQFFYVLPLVGFVLIFRKSPFFYGLTAISLFLSSLALLLHQDTHNDMTFFTSFWVALWLLWFCTQMNKEDSTVMVHARSLALCVVAYIFLGGFVGKLTPEYWDGTVWSNIYMSQEPNLLNRFVRGYLDEPSIRLCFGLLAKIIIIVEGLLVLAPLMPYRIALWLGFGLIFSISLFTTWRIFSVLFCLLGLLFACRPSRSGKIPL